MDQRFLETWFNADGSHVVCGLRLHPFCLSDVMLLEIDENPLWIRHRDITWGDVINAALICSQPAKRFYRTSPRWRIRIILERLWVLRVRMKYHLAEEVSRFVNYVNDYNQKPRFWMDDGDTSEDRLKAPWLISVIAFVESNSNMTEAEILSYPLGKLLWKSAALAEQQGKSRNHLMSEEDIQAMQELGIGEFKSNG